MSSYDASSCHLLICVLSRAPWDTQQGSGTNSLCEEVWRWGLHCKSHSYQPRRVKTNTCFLWDNCVTVQWHTRRKVLFAFFSHTWLHRCPRVVSVPGSHQTSWPTFSTLYSRHPTANGCVIIRIQTLLILLLHSGGQKVDIYTWPEPNGRWNTLKDP